jgi:GTPase Era involved in 16S rRNA processing
VNKICNSKLKSVYGKQSVTQNIWSVSSAYGNGFAVFDTPGFGNDRDKLNHASAIVGALTKEEVSRILVVVKFDRFATMKD